MKLSKKIKLLSLSTIAVGAPIAMVVSCGSTEKSYDFSKVDWSKFHSEDVTILSWVDGDTFSCKDSNNQTIKIRVEFIDTPESHVLKDDGTGSQKWVDTTGLEHDYAIAAFEYGKKEIPIGSKVRLVFSGSETHDRKVASVFYGENYSENYEVNLMAQGLAMPLVSSSGLWMNIHSESNMLHYLALPLGDAYNSAVKNKRGLFGVNAREILKIHGASNTSALEYNPDSSDSVYNYADEDFWK